MQTGALQANGELAPEPVMDVADVARTVRHMAELPLEANVQFATVLATRCRTWGGADEISCYAIRRLDLTSGIDSSAPLRAGRGHMLNTSSPSELHS